MRLKHHRYWYAMFKWDDIEFHKIDSIHVRFIQPNNKFTEKQSNGRRRRRRRLDRIDFFSMNENKRIYIYIYMFKCIHYVLCIYRYILGSAKRWCSEKKVLYHFCSNISSFFFVNVAIESFQYLIYLFFVCEHVCFRSLLCFWCFVIIRKKKKKRS